MWSFEERESFKKLIMSFGYGRWKDILKHFNLKASSSANNTHLEI